MRLGFDEVKVELDKLTNIVERHNIEMKKNIKIMDWKLNLLLKSVLKDRAIIFSKEDLMEFHQLEQDLLKKEKIIKKKKKDLKLIIKSDAQEKEWQNKVMKHCDAKTLNDDKGIMFCHISDKECKFELCPKLK